MRSSLALPGALLALLALIAPPPHPAAAADVVMVSAALSLKGALTEIGALLAAEGGAAPAFNFGASGDLLAQIRGGAPVDVFAPASSEEMDRLQGEGLLEPGSRGDFAANAVVLVVPAGRSAAPASFADLAKPAVSRVAVGNPKTSPAGRYAAELFASSGIAAAVAPKLVPAENVRQVLDWVARGEVDAGVVYATDALARPREVRIAAAAPPGSHTSIVYPVAVLRGTAHLRGAREFIAALRSAAGRAVLARHGFLPPPADR